MKNKKKTKKKTKKGGSNNFNYNTNFYECCNCGKNILIQEGIICDKCNLSIYCSEDCKNINYEMEHHNLCDLYKILIPSNINIKSTNYNIFKNYFIPDYRKQLIDSYINNDPEKLISTGLYTIGNNLFSIPAIYRVNEHITSIRLKQNYPEIIKIKNKMKNKLISTDIINNKPVNINNINNYMCSYLPHEKMIEQIKNFIKKIEDDYDRNIKILEIGCGCGIWKYTLKKLYNIDIIATDLCNSNNNFSMSNFSSKILPNININKINAKKAVKKYQKNNNNIDILFASFLLPERFDNIPPYDAEALKLFEGNYIILIGAVCFNINDELILDYNVTGSLEFIKILYNNWKLVDNYNLGIRIKNNFIFNMGLLFYEKK